ncbi:globin domain-containing protein [Kitasatospora sp. NPDC056138]|uniref:globin domain-containing protein n=1 Tax=Kitasatospora sp. NPDC056138 TaxID=3345724 RepID=UPI0035E22588
MKITRTGEYDRLLARHHAMRLRRQILSPTGPSPERPALGAGTGPYDGHDGYADQQLIRAQLDLVTPFDGLIEHLYAVMFQRRPYLRTLFPESMEFQQDHLARMFRYLIDNLHRPDHVLAVLRQLGGDHRKLGVWPAHYHAFEEALGVALRGRAGAAWTAELEQAWLRMLRFAVGAMVDGAESAITEPPYWRGQVVRHERRGPDVAVLGVRTGEPYRYRAGQYATIESPLLPHTWRQYSMACAPRPDGVLEFHVRRTAAGGVSEALVERTRVGDAVRLGPPRGTMTAADSARDVLLVAGGTGLAPLKAILGELADRGVPGRRVHLFVGARSRGDLYDWEALERLCGRHPWLEAVPVLGGGSRGPRPEATSAPLPGPLSDPLADPLAEAVGRGGDWSERIAYVSGPPGMVGSVRARLLTSGMPADRIRHDPLGSAARG